MAYKLGRKYSFKGDTNLDCQFLISPVDGYTVGLINYTQKTVQPMHGYYYPNQTSMELMKHALNLGYTYIDPNMPKKVNKTQK